MYQEIQEQPFQYLIRITRITWFQLEEVIEQISEGADEHIDRLAKKGMDKYPYPDKGVR